jgi:hypothetical protein
MHLRTTLLFAVCLILYGCAGTARYSVKPFFDPNTQKMVCCEAIAFSGKDVSSLSFDLSLLPDSTVTVHFNETGVGATAPVTAQGAVISNVANAAGQAAAAIVKLTP